MKRGRLIVIEGTDCSGKFTQLNLLVARLNSSGNCAKSFDFPNYNSPTGKVVRMHIDGEFGSPGESDPKVSSVFFAEDRFACKGIICEELEAGKVVVLDRYVESNMANQGGKIRDDLERAKFVDWLDKLEHENFGLPRPDLVVFLHVPYSVSCELILKRQKKSDFHSGEGGLDKYEKCEDYLKNSEESYLQLAKSRGWMTVECAPDGNIDSLKTPEEIHKEVWKRVSSFFD